MEIETKQLVMAVKQITEDKNLPEEVVHDIVGQAIAAAWRKDHGNKDQEVIAQINTNDGSVRVFINKEVVNEVTDENRQISLQDAKTYQANAKLGDTVAIEQKVGTFGRVAAQTAKQVILQKIREAEREVVLDEYSDKIGMVLNGIITRVEPRIVRVDLGRASGIMPKSEQIPGEHYSVGARIKVYLKDVEKSSRGPQLILSRASEELIKQLFEHEVPEMESGAVEIKSIAREAGVRTKIAVASNVPGVDPVGTFVGGHGTRVQAVMSEIGEQEKIDIITYDEDPAKFIVNALSPTEVKSVEIDEDNKKAVVKVEENQLSIAIGKGGQNVRLAAKLTGYEIDVESTSGEKAAAPETAKAKKSRRKNIEESLLEAIEEVGAQGGGEGDAGASTSDDTEAEKESQPETSDRQDGSDGHATGAAA